MKGVERHYDRLTADERFRVAIEAEARGDSIERERLVGSCPRATYRMTELAFQNRVEGSRHVIAALTIELERWAGWVSALHVLRAPIAEAIHGLIRLARGEEVAHVEASDPMEVSDPMETSDPMEASDPLDSQEYPLVVMSVAERYATAQAKAAWEAFEQFSREDVGVDARKLLRAFFPPTLERVESWIERAPALEVDANKVTEWRRMFADAWQSWVEGVE